MSKRWLIQIAYLLMVSVALANAGCVALAIGGAAGGAAAGYAVYQSGQWYRDYNASLNDSATAVKTALTELKMPVVSENLDGDEMTIESRTGDDAKVSIKLKHQPSRVPADGPSTHITVRVGTLGDQPMSTRILDQISMHFVAPVTVKPVATPSALPTNPAPATVSSAIAPVAARESAQPPLAK
jgi:hypothetical protein